MVGHNLARSLLVRIGMLLANVRNLTNRSTDQNNYLCLIMSKSDISIFIDLAGNRNLNASKFPSPGSLFL